MVRTMASAIKEQSDKKPMSNDASDDIDREAPQPKKPSGTSPGFFTVYKSGQGYWTRLGTVLAFALLIGLTAWELYNKIVPLMVEESQKTGRIIQISVPAAFAVLSGMLLWWLVNKPKNVDFLIATDSEMKKVNWTSRKELIGSTKVVVIFMFMIAAFLFVADIAFGYFFYAIDVLKSSPFKGGGTLGGG